MLLYCLMGNAAYLVIDQNKKYTYTWLLRLCNSPCYLKYSYVITNGENWAIMRRVRSDFLLSNFSVPQELNDTLSVFLENIHRPAFIENRCFLENPLVVSHKALFGLFWSDNTHNTNYHLIPSILDGSLWLLKWLNFIIYIIVLNSTINIEFLKICKCIN